RIQLGSGYEPPGVTPRSAGLGGQPPAIAGRVALVILHAWADQASHVVLGELANQPGRRAHGQRTGSDCAPRMVAGSHGKDAVLAPRTFQSLRLADLQPTNDRRTRLCRVDQVVKERPSCRDVRADLLANGGHQFIAEG